MPHTLRFCCWQIPACRKPRPGNRPRTEPRIPESTVSAMPETYWRNYRSADGSDAARAVPGPGRRLSAVRKPPGRTAGICVAGGRRRYSGSERVWRDSRCRIIRSNCGVCPYSRERTGIAAPRRRGATKSPSRCRTLVVTGCRPRTALKCSAGVQCYCCMPAGKQRSCPCRVVFSVHYRPGGRCWWSMRR